MKGYRTLKGFQHGDRAYKKGDIVDFGVLNKDFETLGLIAWFERPAIVKPKRKPRRKKNESKSD